MMTSQSHLHYLPPYCSFGKIKISKHRPLPLVPRAMHSSNMEGEKFCLRWNELDSNLSSAVRDLRDSRELLDLTLACGDTEEDQIQVHRVVLSAASSFFRNLLRRLPHHHPVVYLKGIRQTDLEAVLSFVYNGEVNIAQAELSSFLAVAEDLQVA